MVLRAHMARNLTFLRILDLGNLITFQSYQYVQSLSHNSLTVLLSSTLYSLLWLFLASREPPSLPARTRNLKPSHLCGTFPFEKDWLIKLTLATHSHSNSNSWGNSLTGSATTAAAAAAAAAAYRKLFVSSLQQITLYPGHT
eukprot:jgi/Psemu1/29689/gm1.29689_g